MGYLYYEWFLNRHWGSGNKVPSGSNMVIQSQDGTLYHLACRGDTSYVVAANRQLNKRELSDAIASKPDNAQIFSIQKGSSVELTVNVGREPEVPIRFTHID